jgi:predicted phosphodiesterase
MKRFIGNTLFFLGLLSISFAQEAQGPCFVIYADCRTGHEVHRKIIQAISQTDPAMVFCAGDLVNNGNNPGEWKIFKEIISSLPTHSKYYPAMGNHENSPKLFLENFPYLNNQTWYSVETDKIHFIVLDTVADTQIGSLQYKWLENNLLGLAKDIKFIFVILHHPPFTSGAHPEDEKGLTNSIIPLLEKFKVDAVFAGHSHNYERLRHKGIYYIVTGGGGAPLSPQTRNSHFSQVFLMKHHFCRLSLKNNSLIIEALDSQLNRLDRVTLKKRIRSQASVFF